MYVYNSTFVQCPQSQQEETRAPRTALQMVVSYQGDAGSQTAVPCKSNKCSYPLSHLTNPI